MVPKLVSAEYVAGYTIRLKFADDTKGDVDLRDELWGEVFEPLRDPDLFQQFRLDTALNTVTWPTGADLAPEFLYEKASAHAANFSSRSALEN